MPGPLTTTQCFSEGSFKVGDGHPSVGSHHPIPGGCSLGHSLRAALHCLRVLMPQRKPPREAEAQVPLRGRGGSPCLAADRAGRGVRKGPEPLLPPPCKARPAPPSGPQPGAGPCALEPAWACRSPGAALPQGVELQSCWNSPDVC